MRLDELSLTLGDVDIGNINAESDAKLNDYFVTTPYVKAALGGKHTLFLGRKGSGKSALFGQLPRLLNSANGPVSVVQITPDQYAWSALKEYQEQGLLSEQAHTNAWKLTLAIEAAAAITASDQQWPPAAQDQIRTLRAFLEANFGSTQPGFPTTVKSVLKGLKQFNLSAFGFGVGLQREAAEQPLTPAVAQAVLDLLAEPLKVRGVLLSLDRLDDSWDGSDRSKSLLVGLLKATKDLNDHFGWQEARRGLRSLVFLRSDIYDALAFDDKDKHRPTEEQIVWSADELRTMLERRLPVNMTVDELFTGKMRGGIKSFDYVVRRTFLRPREVLQFIGQCLRQAGGAATSIDTTALRKAEETYSVWKVKDLKQEYAKIFPDFDKLIECLRQQRHRYASIQDLEALIATNEPALVQAHGFRYLLETLFESSVIGVRAGSGPTQYKSEESELTLPTKGAVYVHQSLHRGLRIREAKKGAGAGQLPEPGTLQDRVTIELFSLMLKALPVQDMAFLGLNPKPPDILRHESFEDCIKALGIALEIEAGEGGTLTILRPNRINKDRALLDSAQYLRLRGEMMATLVTQQMSVEEYEAGETAAHRR